MKRAYKFLSREKAYLESGWIYVTEAWKVKVQDLPEFKDCEFIEIICDHPMKSFERT